MASKTPLSTLNRRLSSLRKFSQFGKSQGWLSEIPKMANVTPEDVIHLRETKAQLEGVSASKPTFEVLEKFQKQLQKEKVSSLTIKNYLSDLRHFLSWLEAN